MNPALTDYPSSILLKSRRIITQSNELDGAVEIRDGRIIAVHRTGHIPSGMPVEDLGHLTLLPGLVDVHVHINEPGRTEWEGFESATRAALAGGITTLMDMPLNSSPVCTTAEALQKKRLASRGKLHVDVGFYGGLVRGNAHRMKEMIDEGVFGIKAFLCDSGLDEFQAAREDDLRQAMPVLASAGIPLLVHAELPCGQVHTPGNRRNHAEWLASRPPEMELAAIEMLIRLVRETGCQLQIVHLSTAEALPMITAAKNEGLPIVVETCPHYLYFTSENVPDGDTRFKCAPPIRSAENREQLWQGLRDGIIDRIASDHSPCPPSMKALEAGDFFQAWGGISSLQLGLPLTWTEAHRRGFHLWQACSWWSGDTLTGLAPQWPARQGIAPSSAANLIAFDPDETFTVRGAELHHRHSVTPYEGEKLRGTVQAVWRDGRCIYRNGQFQGAPSGRILYVSEPAEHWFSESLPEVLPQTLQAQSSHLVGSHPSDPETLEHLNQLPADAATELFFRCCGSPPWARKMEASRPYRTHGDLYAAAAWWFCNLFQSKRDWLNPFSHHPRIGDLESLRAKFAATRNWASQEQSGTAEADEETLRALADGNMAYEEKFGYIFIVCATGKSAGEMLTSLRKRLQNDPNDEWLIAAEEQKKITYIRLAKLEIPS